MPITFSCPGCAKTLRVADENAGKVASCPACGARMTVPAVSSSPADLAAPQSTPIAGSPSSAGSDVNPLLRETVLHPGSGSGVNTASWLMRTENGKTYGPVNKPTLDEWMAQGRIASFHFISSDFGATWSSAADVYPELRQASAAFQPSAVARTSSNPFADAPAHGYAPHSAPRPAMGPINGGLSQGQGGVLITFAIIGFACCPVFSIVSLIMGIRELTEIKAGRIRQDAKGLVIASIVISVLALLSWGGLFGAGVVLEK